MRAEDVPLDVVQRLACDTALGDAIDDAMSAAFRLGYRGRVARTLLLAFMALDRVDLKSREAVGWRELWEEGRA